MTELESNLIEKINKMSYMTGIMMASLYNLKTSHQMDMAGIELIDDLLQRMTDFVGTEIYGFNNGEV